MDDEQTIERLSGLTGRWQGDHEGGQLDEQWMAPGGGRCFGCGRWPNKA